MTAGDGAADDGELTYGAALDELEDLLAELEGADVDVDVLATQVARGVELIRFCRARLDVVTDDVDAVVAELVALDGGADGKSADDRNGADDNDGAHDEAGAEA